MFKNAIWFHYSQDLGGGGAERRWGIYYGLAWPCGLDVLLDVKYYNRRVNMARRPQVSNNVKPCGFISLMHVQYGKWIHWEKELLLSFSLGKHAFLRTETACCLGIYIYSHLGKHLKCSVSRTGSLPENVRRKSQLLRSRWWQSNRHLTYLHVCFWVTVVAMSFKPWQQTCPIT